MDRKSKMVMVPVDKIKRPQKIDRISISDKEVSELAESIREIGLLQNPLVRLVDGLYEIIAGDRRILAVKKLGWPEVWCKLCELSDKQTALARATENLQREDLTVIEEANIYLNLKTEYGMKIDQIAARMGISGGTVKRRIDLLKMPKCLQDAMHEKKISYGVAEALEPIKDQTALEYYLGFACDHGVTVTIARQWTIDWKSSMRRKEAEEDPGSILTNPNIALPTYLACDLCQEPERVENFTHLKVCSKCIKRMSGGE